MKFAINRNRNWYKRIFYWIFIESNYNKNVNNDEEIAKRIGITLEKYQQELMKFNKNAFKINDDIVFFRQSDVNRALKYLKNKYGILIKLLEE
jgi:DNA-directed RNA polymerase specialized sigma subunit